MGFTQDAVSRKDFAHPVRHSSGSGGSSSASSSGTPARDTSGSPGSASENGTAASSTGAGSSGSQDYVHFAARQSLDGDAAGKVLEALFERLDDRQ